MSEQFERGAVVVLKSGGPKMTISYIDDEGRCDCQWFDNRDLISGIFYLTSLERAQEPLVPRLY